MIHQINQQAARRFHQAIVPHMDGKSLLDVGAAEGMLGAAMAADGYEVTLLDVVDMNQSSLPVQLYDGHTFPFEDNSFDTVIISLVLHHCQYPVSVLDEAIRVSRRRLLISESVYRTTPGKWILWTLDHLFNGLRSGWKMPGALYFKTEPQWRQLFESRELTLQKEIHLSRGLHRHTLFILDRNEPESGCP